MSQYIDKRPLRRETTEANAFVALLLVVSVCGLVVDLLPAAQGATIPLIHALPFVLVIATVLAYRLASFGTADLPWNLFAIGALFVVGGALFDMAATVMHSPDLSQEQNPVARELLDGGHSLSLVYGFAAVCQGLWVTTICLLWAGLLRHRRTIVDAVRTARTKWQLLKAATGGARLTWRQWMFPLTFSELPDMHFYVWVIAVVFVSASIERWYLGLEWFGVTYGYRIPISVGGIVVGQLIYSVWLYRAWARHCASAILPPADALANDAATETSNGDGT